MSDRTVNVVNFRTTNLAA